MSTIAGYGTDTWCADSLVTGRMARGVLVVALALYRRFITPRGTLQGGEEEAAYGFDVAEWVGAVGYDTAIQSLPGIMAAEAQKDDRVSSAVVSVARADSSDGTITLDIAIDVMLQNAEDTFALTLRVSDAGVAFQGVAT